MFKVPYRNRDVQLRLFLNHMHVFLQKQLIDYAIYIVEEDVDLLFNRALLMNIGYIEALKDYNWDCFVFHDVGKKFSLQKSTMLIVYFILCICRLIYYQKTIEIFIIVLKYHVICQHQSIFSIIVCLMKKYSEVFRLSTRTIFN